MMNEYQRGAQQLWRALLLRCPACGEATFVRGIMRTHASCRVCGLLFERDDAFFLGAAHVGYGLTFLLGILPSLVLVAMGVWGGVLATVVALVLCLVLPLAFYWHMKTIWMAFYYWVCPDDLQPVEDEPDRVPYHPREGLSEQERLWLEEAICDLEGGKQLFRPGAR
jgi:uncharacterized protein (DUF983 family)